MNNDNDNDWRKQEEDRNKQFLAEVEKWLGEIVSKQVVLNFHWESGGDEAFLTLEKFDENDEGKKQDLEEYLILKLDIPDAGEFEMKGEGKLYFKDSAIWAAYQSVIRMVEDYDEEKEEEIYGEAEVESTDKKLFAI